MPLASPITEHLLHAPAQGQWTVQDMVFHLPQDDGCRYELIDGVVYVTTQPHWEHQGAATELVIALGMWNKQTKAGRIFFAPGVIFGPTKAVVPDIVWVRRERLQDILHSDGKLHGAPDLVMEILSPGLENSERDRTKKRNLYGRHGVLEYWIVDRFQRHIEVYRSVGNKLDLSFVCGANDMLTSPLLPGFTCYVGEIFDD